MFTTVVQPNTISIGSSPQAKAEEYRQKAFGLTSGVSDQIMQDAQIKAALDRLQSATKEGPLSQAVQTQMANRNAGMLARAEGVNAEQLRADAANSGLSPDDPGFQAALRQGQAQRQAGQIAFAGDLATRAAQMNYGAQNDAARALAGTRMSQYGQAQPGYGWAANLYADTNVAGSRTPTVATGAARPASSGGSSGGAGFNFNSRPLDDPWGNGTRFTVVKEPTAINTQDRDAGRGMTNYDGSAFKPGQINPVGGSIFATNYVKPVKPPVAAPQIPASTGVYGKTPTRAFDF